jgi:hypothetical protein
VNTTFGCLDCGAVYEAGTLNAHIFEFTVARGEHPMCPNPDCGCPLWDVTPTDALVPMPEAFREFVLALDLSGL